MKVLIMMVLLSALLISCGKEEKKDSTASSPGYSLDRLAQAGLQISVSNNGDYHDSLVLICNSNRPATAAVRMQVLMELYNGIQGDLVVDTHLASQQEVQALAQHARDNFSRIYDQGSTACPNFVIASLILY